ncbi:hypothetical protein EK21DRAFT_15803, partial [Setomelanomma holmii]
ILMHEVSPTKKRKVRKGTRNCWECKRRKVRCIYALPANKSCENCIQRQITCISQEYDDGQAERTDGGIEERLKRIENTLESLVVNATAATAFEGALQGQKPSSPNAVTPQFLDNSMADHYTGLARDLVAAWPPEHDLDQIYELPIGLSTHVHMKVCTTSSTQLNQEPESPRTMLRLPPRDSHPVMFARKLLLLSSLLQGAVSSPHTPTPTRNHLSAIMTHALDTAVRFVTTNDDLTASVEGIECIMIEAMIQNYAGNLHKACMAVRRATTVAQMVGLHRYSHSSSLRILDPNTRAGLDPQQLYFRIIEMDSYLSVTLGLPRSSIDTKALSPAALAACQPLDRMARLQCIIAGYILDRKGAAIDTQDIEDMLQNAAAVMPAQWWLVPAFQAHDNIAPDTLHDVAQAMYQLSHYHLVLRIHLPFLLRPAQEKDSNYHKLAAAMASREILTRYSAFRIWNPGHFYCRGLDYLAFIAVMVLSLAHINSQCLIGSSNTSGIRQVLRLNRPSDRGLMEHILTTFDRMPNDEILSRLAPILRHILDVELDAAAGVEYDAVATGSGDGASGLEGGFVDSKKRLQIHIPHFGTINLER